MWVFLGTLSVSACFKGGQLFAETMSLGINPGKLGSQQENLGGMINPHQHDHQRAGCAEARPDGALMAAATAPALAPGIRNFE